MGFNGDRVLTASIAPPARQYRDPAALRQLYQRLLDRASAIPGVRAAGLTNMLPLSGGDFTLSFQIQGRPPAATPGDEPVAGTRIVSASYVSTMGMRLVQGRDLSPLDTENAPGAVLVNETMAKRYWAGQSPLGAKIYRSTTSRPRSSASSATFTIEVRARRPDRKCTSPSRSSARARPSSSCGRPGIRRGPPPDSARP